MMKPLGVKLNKQIKTNCYNVFWTPIMPEKTEFVTIYDLEFFPSAVFADVRLHSRLIALDDGQPGDESGDAGRN
jgi:hypothetical protein